MTLEVRGSRRLDIERDSILVTGATGFVGRRLVGLLSQQGHRLIGSARAAPLGEALRPFSEFALGDLSQPFDLSHLLSRSRAVVHLASRVHVMRETDPDPDQAFRAANALATKELASQAAAAGVPLFVYMSSIKVCGERTSGRAFSVGDPLLPEDAYARSKVEAEAALEAVASGAAMKVVALRPPLVFGSDARANFGALLRLVSVAPALPFGGIENRRSLISAESLASAVSAVLEAPKAALAPRFQAFAVSDLDPISTPELVRALAEGLGKRPRLVRVPRAAFRLLGRIVGGASIARLTEDLEIDSSVFANSFAWRPERTLRESLQNAAREWAVHRSESHRSGRLD